MVTPSGRLRCSTAAVSLSEDVKVEYRTSRTQEIQVGGKVNKASFTLLSSPGPAHTENNFAPNEYRGVVNSSGLDVYKGSTLEIKEELKVRTEIY